MEWITTMTVIFWKLLDSPFFSKFWNLPRTKNPFPYPEGEITVYERKTKSLKIVENRLKAWTPEEIPWPILIETKTRQGWSWRRKKETRRKIISTFHYHAFYIRWYRERVIFPESQARVGSEDRYVNWDGRVIYSRVRFSSILLIVYLESEILAECQVGRNESIIYSASTRVLSLSLSLLLPSVRNHASPVDVYAMHACITTAESNN